MSQDATIIMTSSCHPPGWWLVRLDQLMFLFWFFFLPSPWSSSTAKSALPSSASAHLQQRHEQQKQKKKNSKHPDTIFSLPFSSVLCPAFSRLNKINTLPLPESAPVITHNVPSSSSLSFYRLLHKWLHVVTRPSRQRKPPPQTP